MRAVTLTLLPIYIHDPTCAPNNQSPSPMTPFSFLGWLLPDSNYRLPLLGTLPAIPLPSVCCSFYLLIRSQLDNCPGICLNCVDSFPSCSDDLLLNSAHLRRHFRLPARLCRSRLNSTRGVFYGQFNRDPVNPLSASQLRVQSSQDPTLLYQPFFQLPDSGTVEPPPLHYLL
jgi:hypothetical protein